MSHTSFGTLAGCSILPPFFYYLYSRYTRVSSSCAPRNNGEDKFYQVLNWYCINFQQLYPAVNMKHIHFFLIFCALLRRVQTKKLKKLFFPQWLLSLQYSARNCNPFCVKAIVKWCPSCRPDNFNHFITQYMAYAIYSSHGSLDGEPKDFSNFVRRVELSTRNFLQVSSSGEHNWLNFLMYQIFIFLTE